MNTKTPAQLAAVQAVQILGGSAQAARVLGVKGGRYQTVQGWLRNRVPAEQCPGIERETRRLGNAVHCEAMRPDVPWSVVRESDGPARTDVAAVDGMDVPL